MENFKIRHTNSYEFYTTLYINDERVGLYFMEPGMSEIMAHALVDDRSTITLAFKNA